MAGKGTEKDLYCICRKEWVRGQFMIACDKCDDWFHGKCVCINKNEANKIANYTCPRCKDEGKSDIVESENKEEPNKKKKQKRKRKRTEETNPKPTEKRKRGRPPRSKQSDTDDKKTNLTESKKSPPITTTSVIEEQILITNVEIQQEESKAEPDQDQDVETKQKSLYFSEDEDEDLSLDNIQLGTLSESDEQDSIQSGNNSLNNSASLKGKEKLDDDDMEVDIVGDIEDEIDILNDSGTHKTKNNKSKSQSQDNEKKLSLIHI
eukprot:TRINITY_DN6994_c0_g1_i1.p1 TRINITY_DN6994_c0_g1~~TRINITY_DN6994_c0_g1_i1.p1  ORF type:complete len:264 (+),score=73.40 TRINITY_DN6994_c0_g1_i1:52-843(+)